MTEQQPPKRLTRDTEHRMLGGVCAGIANYFGWDVTLVRVIFLILTFAIGSGVLVYLLAWVIIPADTAADADTANGDDNDNAAQQPDATGGTPPRGAADIPPAGAPADAADDTSATGTAMRAAEEIARTAQEAADRIARLAREASGEIAAAAERAVRREPPAASGDRAAEHAPAAEEAARETAATTTDAESDRTDAADDDPPTPPSIGLTP